MKKITELQPNDFRKPLRLQGAVQNYAWGAKHPCLVSRQLDTVDPNLPYAELWFGAHSKGPSMVEVSGAWFNLREVISLYPTEVLGPEVAAHISDLPFLLKLLSIKEALSIQAHPDIFLAGKLHARDSVNYPDSNHKVEVAIAVGDFLSLIGFRTVAQVWQNINETPELFDLLELDSPTENPSAEWLKSSYTRLLSCPQAQVELACQRLFQRLAVKASLSAEEKVILELARQFPSGDVGIFSVYFLNLVRLSAGQAVLVAPNVAHAYLSGEVIECMTSSDNVVRGGLTSKFIDRETLLGMLDFSPWQIKDYIYDLNNKDSQRIVFPNGARCKIRVIQNQRITSEELNALDFRNPSYGPSFVFNLEGMISIHSGDSKFTLEQGECILLPYELSSYSLDTSNGKAIFLTA